MSNGWQQGKTLSNGWTIHTNWMHRSKEYRSPCGDFKVEKQRDNSWRLMEKSSWPDGSRRWQRIVSMSQPSRCIRLAEEIINGGNEQ